VEAFADGSVEASVEAFADGSVEVMEVFMEGSASGSTASVAVPVASRPVSLFLFTASCPPVPSRAARGIRASRPLPRPPCRFFAIFHLVYPAACRVFPHLLDLSAAFSPEDQPTAGPSSGSRQKVIRKVIFLMKPHAAKSRGCAGFFPARQVSVPAIHRLSFIISFASFL